MMNALIFNVPVELGLEFLAIISLNFPNAKREHCNDPMAEVDGVGLIVPKRSDRVGIARLDMMKPFRACGDIGISCAIDAYRGETGTNASAQKHHCLILRAVKNHLAK